MATLQFLIRQMTKSDLDSVTVIEQVSRLAPWGHDGYLRVLDSPAGVRALVAEGRVGEEQQGPVMGFVVAQVLAHEMEIYQIAVHPDFRRVGVGTSLMEYVLGEGERSGCRECYLDVRRGNLEAINFYIKHGFEVCGVRPRYYRNPSEDALVMRKRLKT
ncbi:MAG: ribosomal protein S18-alanine N-acetyltransferase [Acidobacteria bacterium]|nr:ribosomal protein S18-alanine N-acetyltransferase [Acidobacteriota bacterium]